MSKRVTLALFRSALRLLNELKSRPQVLHTATLKAFGPPLSGSRWSYATALYEVRKQFRTQDTCCDPIDQGFVQLRKARESVQLLPVDLQARIRRVSQRPIEARPVALLGLVGDIVASRHSDLDSSSFVDDAMEKCANFCASRVQQVQNVVADKVDVLQYCRNEALVQAQKFRQRQVAMLRQMPKTAELQLAQAFSVEGFEVPSRSRRTDRDGLSLVQGMLAPSEQECKIVEESFFAQLLLRAADNAGVATSSTEPEVTGRAADKPKIEVGIKTGGSPSSLSSLNYQMLLVHALRRETLGQRALELCPTQCHIMNEQLMQQLGIGTHAAGVKVQRQHDNTPGSSSSSLPLLATSRATIGHLSTIDIGAALGLPRSRASTPRSLASNAPHTPDLNGYRGAKTTSNKFYQNPLPSSALVHAAIAQDALRRLGLVAEIGVPSSAGVCSVQLPIEWPNDGGARIESRQDWIWNDSNILLDLYSAGAIETAGSLARRMVLAPQSKDPALLSFVKRETSCSRIDPSVLLQRYLSASERLVKESAAGIHGQAHGWANDAGDARPQANVSPQGRAASHTAVGLHAYESADVLLERLRLARTQCSSLAVLEGLDRSVS